MDVMKEGQFARTVDPEAELAHGRSYAAALGEHAANPERPRTQGIPLVGLGRDWLVSTDETRIKAQWEECLMERVEKRISQMTLSNPLMADMLRSQYICDLAAGNFSWDGKVSRAAKSEWEGNCLLLFLMIRRCCAEVTLDDARELMHDDSAACMTAVRRAEGNWQSSLARSERAQVRAREKKEREDMQRAMNTNGGAANQTTTHQNPGQSPS